MEEFELPAIPCPPKAALLKEEPKPGLRAAAEPKGSAAEGEEEGKGEEVKEVVEGVAEKGEAPKGEGCMREGGGGRAKGLEGTGAVVSLAEDWKGLEVEEPKTLGGPKGEADGAELEPKTVAKVLRVGGGPAVGAAAPKEEKEGLVVVDGAVVPKGEAVGPKEEKGEEKEGAAAADKPPKGEEVEEVPKGEADVVVEVPKGEGAEAVDDSVNAELRLPRPKESVEGDLKRLEEGVVKLNAGGEGEEEVEAAEMMVGFAGVEEVEEVEEVEVVAVVGALNEKEGREAAVEKEKVGRAADVEKEKEGRDIEVEAAAEEGGATEERGAEEVAEEVVEEEREVERAAADVTVFEEEEAAAGGGEAAVGRWTERGVEGTAFTSASFLTAKEGVSGSSGAEGEEEEEAEVDVEGRSTVVVEVVVNEGVETEDREDNNEKDGVAEVGNEGKEKAGADDLGGAVTPADAVEAFGAFDAPFTAPEGDGADVDEKAELAGVVAVAGKGGLLLVSTASALTGGGGDLKLRVKAGGGPLADVGVENDRADEEEEGRGEKEKGVEEGTLARERLPSLRGDNRF